MFSSVACVADEANGQRCLIATCDLSINQEIVDENYCTGRSYSSFANDADFQYPTSFDVDDLVVLFQAYVATSVRQSKCNLVYLEEGRFIITKQIRAGEQITKRYGMSDWYTYLWMDIGLGKNPFHNINETSTTTQFPESAVHNIKLAFMTMKARYLLEFQTGPDTKRLAQIFLREWANL